MIFLKRAISLLLILTTILGCCGVLFACNDPQTITGGGTLANTETQILDVSTTGNPEGGKYGEQSSVRWNLKKSDATSRIFSLDLTATDLSSYKEITFWMNNTSGEAFRFNFFFINEDGTRNRATADLDNPYIERIITSGFGNKVDMKTVNWLVAYPGWHKYTIPLSEVEALAGNAGVEYTYDEETGKTQVKFDKSTIKTIEFNASNTNISQASIAVDICSINANTNKHGTIKGFGIDKIANAVCFMKTSTYYLYDQLRYYIPADDNGSLFDESDELELTAGKSIYVPIAVLAQHRGAEIVTNTKDNCTFKYDGKTYSYTVGDNVTYVGAPSGIEAGATKTVKVSSKGIYVTIPMEAAAEALGYQLFYDVTGFAMFSDLKNPDENTNWKKDADKVTWVKYTDPNYYEDDLSDDVPGRQVGEIMKICKVITYTHYTGEEILGDMDALLGENSHGNLVVNNKQIEMLKDCVENDPVYKAWFSVQEQKYAPGSAAFTNKLPEFILSDGQRMTTDGMVDIEPLAFMYRMTGEERYAKRVVQIMNAMVRMTDWMTEAPSWHPEHFLDCATSMYYFSIGFDWCYDYIAEDKALLEKFREGAWEYAYGAIMGHGELYEWWIDPANLQAYREKANADPNDDILPAPWGSTNIPFAAYDLPSQFSSSTRYAKSTYDRSAILGNWNQVCMSGMIHVAFAFANEGSKFRAASEYILNRAVNEATYGMVDCFSPDGGHPEGPGYWLYGSKDLVNILVTLRNCTGQTFGLIDFPGWEDSFYYVLGIGSTGFGSWNYHDGGEAPIQSSLNFLAADLFDNPALAEFRFSQVSDARSSKGLEDIFFYNPEYCKENINLNSDLDLDYLSHKIATVTFRSDWSENGMFCGLHGGANNAGHGQLDIGNFILEYNGVRFFGDLGSDNYVLSGYFSYPQRHWIYVNRAEGHNTLIINPTKVNKGNTKWGEGGQFVNVWQCDQAQRATGNFNYDQAYSAISEITGYASYEKTAYAKVQFGTAYGYYDTKLKQMVNPTGERGLLILDNRSTVIIQDELDITAISNSTKTNQVLWMGHIVNGGTIEIAEDKQTAMIKYNGMTLMCSIVTPEDSNVTWKFESRSSDYLRETGLSMSPGENSRDGKQKLVAIGTVGTEIKLAVVCRLLSAGPHSYTWTDLDDWDSLMIQ